MVRREVIERRLKKLDEYFEILQNLQKYSRNEFLSNPERYGSAERFLQLSIETTIDVGNHLVADMSLGEVQWSSDIPSILAKKGYLSVPLRETWIRMIGFRNLLVHDYLEIDRETVYEILQNNLDDLEALKKIFAGFL
ncbi:MAG: hypothetical protein B6I38_06315 [Anaerolineaceae bacterium 4572_5.1]|nr:MAG: hypothetical protein B6I38_06315 [Anaerolineaceae bacterium 4572_5.1]